jgi:hypothetical protein
MGAARGHRKSPRNLRRLENRSSRCALSLSGSGAPSNLRVAAAVTGACPAGSARPRAFRSPCRSPARLAALPRRRGSPAARPKTCHRGPDPASTLRRQPGPEGSASGLATFVGSPEFRVWPCGLRRSSRSGSPPCGGSANLARSPRVERFDCLERGELYGPRRARSTPRFRRSEYECAGRGPAKKSDNSQRKVTCVTADDERAGQGPVEPRRSAPAAPDAASTSS